MAIKLLGGIAVGAAGFLFLKRMLNDVRAASDRDFDDLVRGLAMKLLTRDGEMDPPVVESRLRAALNAGSHRAEDFPGIARVALDLTKISPSKLNLAVVVHREQAHGPALRAMREIDWADLPEEFRRALIQSGEKHLEYPLSVRIDS